ncbi:MAG: pantetheine-phosphate adenylyltransferase [Spirochaetales bacterium]|nr:pantetheine-phosphate adenylyltransferase [Spirochaetales bacterium]
MIKAVFPGTFDPPTNGHMNIIHRVSRIFDEIDVVIADNDEKKCLFTTSERFDMLSELCKDITNVRIHTWTRLVVEFAEENDAKVIIRGVRALTDFGYEFELAMTNKSLNPNIEIVFMPTDPKYFVLRSSMIKQIARMQGRINKMVPEVVVQALQRKFPNA